MSRRKSNPPTIREAVRAAAESRGLTAYAVAKATDGAVSDDMLKRYFEGRSDLTSAKLDAVFRVLGLSILTGGSATTG